MCRLFAASRGKRSLSSDSATRSTARLALFYSSCCLFREVQDGDNDGETAFVLLDQPRRDSARSRPEPLAARGPEGYLLSCSTGQLARKIPSP